MCVTCPSQRPVGRALTPEERKRLFDGAASNPEWEHVYCAAVVAANTSMRPVEVKHLRRRDVDLVKKLVYVRRSKNETSQRVIPLNASAITAVARMLERGDLLGHTEPDHFLWPRTTASMRSGRRSTPWTRRCGAPRRMATQAEARLGTRPVTPLNHPTATLTSRCVDST
jgi:integrase